MPRLANPRHERFAQAVHKGYTQRRAYIDAGYSARKPARSVDASPVDRCASRLRKYVQVEERLSELRAMALKRHEITVDTLLTQLAADRDLAHRTEQSAAAVSATMAMGKLVGLIVERKETGAPGDFANLQSTQEVIAAVRKELGNAAADALAALAATDSSQAAEPALEEPAPPSATHDPPPGRQ